MYLPPNTPRRSISAGVRSGLNPENVRASLDQTAGSRGAIRIGEVSMTIGFARDWLAWHDQQKVVREAGFRRWQFIASATVLLAAIGLALKAWLKW
jgi:hypothetical protein